MTVFPSCDFPVLTDAETIERLSAAVSDREPFSLIRLNDGEAVALAFDGNLALQDLAYLHGHWGAEGVSLDDVADVKLGLEDAARGADIIGIRDDIVDVSLPDDLLSRENRDVKEVVTESFHMRPTEVDNLSAIGARRLALLHRVLSRFEWSDDQHFCSVWIHWELAATGALETILDGVDEVGLVTSRPELEYLVARRFDVRTSIVTVPDKFIDAGGSGQHVPNRYRTIRPELDFPSGSLVLVGAGIPGKVYCQWLKERGCVAIDIGAVFDAWIGKASRPRVLESRFGVRDGDVVPTGLQLHVPTAHGERQLTPKWKPTGLTK